jgi:hypothetical protein
MTTVDRSPSPAARAVQLLRGADVGSGDRRRVLHVAANAYIGDRLAAGAGHAAPAFSLRTLEER